MPPRKPAAAPDGAAKPEPAVRTSPSAAAKAPNAKSSRPAKAVVVKERAVSSDAPSAAPPVVKLKEIIDRVVQAANLKKKDVKPVVEATLKVLGNALASGEALIVPPLGRLRVSRAKDMANGAMLTLRLKRGAGDRVVAKADDDLAENDE